MLLIASILVFNSLSSRNLIEIKIDLKLIYINKCVEIAVATIYYLKKITSSDVYLIIEIYRYRKAFKIQFKMISCEYLCVMEWNLRLYNFYISSDLSLSLVFGKCKRLESAENFAMLFFEKDPSVATS